MDEILHHLGALNYCNSWDFRDLRWCKISSINSIEGSTAGKGGHESHLLLPNTALSLSLYIYEYRHACLCNPIYPIFNSHKLPKDLNPQPQTLNSKP